LYLPLEKLGFSTIKPAIGYTAAMSAIQLNGEYKKYYQRRNTEGKNKMSTLNIIRNKLVFRVFAVIKRQTP